MMKVQHPLHKPGTYALRVDTVSLAIADVSLYGDPDAATWSDWYINRINVPKKHRGKGFGSMLLKAILEDADKAGVTVNLEISESDGLNYKQLELWYKRYGFKGFLFYTRKPRNKQK